ncbi:MAG: V-type ATP synthase subunit D [Candidatus Omnitrophota bacterium]|jgi:V/A-type H+-transporting ATPase subunit D
MVKIKFTKGELKRQRGALKQYERYLPTLQLKKQQLQMEILTQHNIEGDRKRALEAKMRSAEAWAGLLCDPGVDTSGLARIKEVLRATKNISGVDIPVFERLEFESFEYDFFFSPLWVDTAMETIRQMVSLKEEIKTIEEGIVVLRHELMITTQRVNLFEKVKIPEARDIIRKIKIYIGDQMANAVGRSKVAKRKIQEYILEGVAA